jgi:hypothetical protein
VEQQVEKRPVQKRIPIKMKKVGAAAAVRTAEIRYGSGGEAGNIPRQGAFQIQGSSNRQAGTILRFYPGEKIIDVPVQSFPSAMMPRDPGA